MKPRMIPDDVLSPPPPGMIRHGQQRGCVVRAPNPAARKMNALKAELAELRAMVQKLTDGRKEELEENANSDL